MMADASTSTSNVAIHRSSEEEDPECYDYVFGFGSIMNTSTHAPWLADDHTTTTTTTTTTTPTSCMPGQRAHVRGYRRGWNFRSNTGFTALGITPTKDEMMNGVLFRIPRSLLAGFDRREVGYDRLAISKQDLELLPSYQESSDTNSKWDVVLEIQSNELIWIYVPQVNYCAEANEDHPILQSYVDTVMQGCLEWGGEGMAHEFVLTTHNWSPYFLNDTPSSRRPWLFRKEYNTIDRILSQHHDSTHFADRRHPEEFASAFLIKMMRGFWSIPRRNAVFTGRDAEIGQVHARLTAQRTNAVAKLEVVGMGGVGKTQLVTEYCYRYFPSYYGLVIWLSAQSAESVAAGYRQLMADTTTGDVILLKEKDTDEVVAQVKARLYHSKVPWLLVFDNLDDPCLLDRFVPHGGTGHVLVTTRLVHADHSADYVGDSSIRLGCFHPSESVELLCRSAGKQNVCNSAHIEAAHQLAEHLGHLPLALGMAAAYMRRCDVDCSEYLARYETSETSGALLGHEAVSFSLSLSLNVIQEENRTAWEALRLLGWLGPDQITKKLLRSLLMARNDKAKEEAQAAARRVSERATLSRKLESGTVLPLVGGIALLSLAAIGHHALGNARKDRRVGTTAVVALSLSASAMFSRHYYKRRWESTSALGKVTAVGPPSLTRTTSISADVFEQTDQIWKIFKSFSLLVVKDGKGSIHRLLAQALRVSQNTQDARRNLEICLRAVLQAWTFKPEQVETWQDSINLLEHIKAVVLHSIDQRCELRPETAILSREAGVFIAMTLNDFGEAQLSLEQSLKILNVIGKINPTYSKAHAAALHELGRVFRYKGQFQKSEESLQRALEIRNRLAGEDLDARHGVASTLHELGVLEVKKHNLDLATTFLQQSLDLRHSLELEVPVNDIEADCASTLHQLAAVQVAHKPPSLDKAESLLKEALGLNMQIGQRAATLKQLARVAMRRGDFEIAERSLDQALELYVEMYGENTLHVNVAALKFQQGALAFQREQLEQAWLHFSECLRARGHVYAYSQGNHLEVSSVLHELGCVAFAQKRLTKACEMLTAEKAILVQLYETSSQRDRLFQARLTNLTWLRKCAKESGDNEEVRKKGAERTALKWEEKQQASKTPDKTYPQVLALQQEALHCRAVARQFALARVARPERKEPTQVQVKAALANLLNEIERSPVCPLRETAAHLHMIVTESLASSNKSSITRVFEACDSMRDVLRDHGMEVSDDSQRSKRL